MKCFGKHHSSSRICLELVCKPCAHLPQFAFLLVVSACAFLCSKRVWMPPPFVTSLLCVILAWLLSASIRGQEDA